MLEKSNRIGPLADRQKVLLTARLGVFPFSRIFNYRESGKFSREIVSSLIILTFFLIFSISDLIFSILLRCF